MLWFLQIKGHHNGDRDLQATRRHKYFLLAGKHTLLYMDWLILIWGFNPKPQKFGKFNINKVLYNNNDTIMG